MRCQLLTHALMGMILLGMFGQLGLAWSEAEREIFRLRQEIIETEGSEVDFYSFIGARRYANLDEINRAYRKASIKYHPDKQKPKPLKGQTTVTPGQRRAFAKRAQEAYARLNLVVTILRNGSQRGYYDHFLKHGFPFWKGTGYYYSRFRPGVGSVLLGLLVFVGGAGHYCLLALTARQSRSNMQERIVEARAKAREKGWKPRTKKPKRVILESGKQCFVDGNGDVFMIGYSVHGKQPVSLLDVENIEGPQLKNTILARFSKWLFNIAVGVYK